MSVDVIGWSFLVSFSMSHDWVCLMLIWFVSRCLGWAAFVSVSNDLSQDVLDGLSLSQSLLISLKMSWICCFLSQSLLVCLKVSWVGCLCVNF